MQQSREIVPGEIPRPGRIYKTKARQEEEKSRMNAQQGRMLILTVRTERAKQEPKGVRSCTRERTEPRDY